MSKAFSADLPDGGDAGKRQEEAEMVGEILVRTGDGLAARQVLGLEIHAVGRQDELRFGFGGRGAVLQRRQRLRDLSRVACGDVNVVGLKNAAKVGLVRGAGAQPLDRRLLVAESFEEGIRKVLGVKRLIRQLRNGFFYFNGVQLSAPPGVTT